jgi:hypothetical protein
MQQECSWEGVQGFIATLKEKKGRSEDEMS